MKKFKFTISGKQYEVEVQSFEGDKAQVVVNGTQYEVDVEREKEEARPVVAAPRPAAAPKADAPKAAAAGDANGHKAVAPLPGTIMQIFVNVGDQVKRGDKILMYEAMKMENNFLAEVDGEIKDIKVRVGDNVLQGAVLVVIG
ncbi:MAG: acetyl-CoA carboxylase biotin carboxyl carrier protein subunit [Bacteroidales bacterium]|nr:acetyl-CoA carboxylase biotin carboxyl carrier protein subunit [Lentimicrobiaceae bacterium]MBQ2906494.1 acetyl-CoA carboxylase biotin carboxyl carrier protein subunit [Bacteroidales bacterium]MBQ3595761.1 acetyl-CoA carboxylase biotin carboxyl carrier protein subunit [Bacteroidales bacterium]MBR3915299.1 acetyl-CoA carboxylase biotin carboxyl carrier protein subunit [Bacteroidales bacterium]